MSVLGFIKGLDPLHATVYDLVRSAQCINSQYQWGKKELGQISWIKPKYFKVILYL